MNDKKALLEVKDLQVDFLAGKKRVTAVHDINFSVDSGTVLGIVGESGCGKSVTATTVLRLLPKQTSVIAKGEILFDGKDIVKMSEHELCSVRGNRISMIFQDPMTALNPVYTIGAQLIEMIRAHNSGISKSEAFERGAEMLEKVGIPSPRARMNDYPHQLSGGMRQRVMIAMALSCDPALLIADEPTTALDVTIQAQILDLIRKLKDETGTAVMMITHDLGVIANISDYVMVMYAGEIVEYGTVAQILEAPLHPYTEGLQRSIPRLDTDVNRELYTIEGTVPSLNCMPSGCRFANRCSLCTEKCISEAPELYETENGRKVRCFRYC